MDERGELNKIVTLMDIGLRPYQQDRVITCPVLPDCAQLSTEQFIDACTDTVQALQKIYMDQLSQYYCNHDEVARQHLECSGSTLCFGSLTHKVQADGSSIYQVDMINVGDSFGCLVILGPNGVKEHLILNPLDQPDPQVNAGEYLRVADYVELVKRTHRLTTGTQLMISRSMGDFASEVAYEHNLIVPVLSHRPTIIRTQGQSPADQDEVLVLASDGLNLTSAEIARIVHENVGDLNKIAAELHHAARLNGSTDNFAVVVIREGSAAVFDGHGIYGDKVAEMLKRYFYREFIEQITHQSQANEAVVKAQWIERTKTDIMRIIEQYVAEEKYKFGDIYQLNRQDDERDMILKQIQDNLWYVAESYQNCSPNPAIKWFNTVGELQPHRLHQLDNPSERRAFIDDVWKTFVEKTEYSARSFARALIKLNCQVTKIKEELSPVWSATLFQEQSLLCEALQNLLSLDTNYLNWMPCEIKILENFQNDFWSTLNRSNIRVNNDLKSTLIAIFNEAVSIPPEIFDQYLAKASNEYQARDNFYAVAGRTMISSERCSPNF